MMKKELNVLLCQRYPLIFSERRCSIKESCMGWGFACGDGWFDLIDALCARLQFWTDRNGAPQVTATQVKEKWGALHFHPRGASQEQWGMVWMAEAMSSRICEQCGKPGQRLVDGFYHMTRCAEHAPAGAMSISEWLDAKKQRLTQ
jgi:hypothetical protein